MSSKEYLLQNIPNHITISYTISMYSDYTNKIPKRRVIQKELQKETAERLSRIDTELADGFDFMNRYNDTVSFFGSARLPADSPHYKKAQELAGALAKDGYTIVTGGGEGIMEAADRGAMEAGNHSIGLNIKLPHEQVVNPYATDVMSFKYFFTRKVTLAYGAMAYVYFPGGFGTLDELFEIVTMVQTRKMPKAPIILVGSEFWTALDRLVKTYMLNDLHTISPGDEKLYTITDDIFVIQAMIDDHRNKTSALSALAQPAAAA